MSNKKPDGTADKSPKLVDIERAREILGLPSVASLYMKVARRQVPYRKVGTRLMFVESELFDFVNKLPGLRLEEISK